MKKLLDFNPDGMKKLHFFTENLNFPVAVAVYTDQEEMQVSCLTNNIKSGNFNSQAICEWRINHQIQYRIIYPLKKSSILKHPYKYMKYLQLKKKLNYSL